MKKVKLLIFMIFLLGSVSVYSQIGVTSYSIHAFGVHTSKERQITGELKAFFNRDIDFTVLELTAMYNFQGGDYHRFSAGLGFNFAPFNGFSAQAFTLPVQLEIFPLQNFRQLSLVMELAPRWDVDFSDFFEVRHLWGIRYTFSRR